MADTVSVHIPTALRAHVNDQAQVDLEAGTIQELLDRLVAEHPGLKGRLLDDQGRETGAVAPGEDLYVELTFEACIAGIHVDSTLDLWTEDVLMAKSRLPTLFTVPHEGHYFFSVQIGEALFEQSIERAAYQANILLVFYRPEAMPRGFLLGSKPDPENQPPREQDIISCAVTFEVRGDIDQRYRRLEYSAGVPDAPLLRPRLAWSVERNVPRRDKH